MKGDITRSTFKKENRYHGVRMQQGRVQMDADWNEQLDIQSHRTESETLDTTGKCGAPLHNPGFHLVASTNELSPGEKSLPENQDAPPLEETGDFYISGGRLYAGGRLCENLHIVPYSAQPDMPAPEPVSQPGTYLAYLDVWLRHITALENGDIREKALGGPDTATRTQTLWQVKLLHLGDEKLDVNCLSDQPAWNTTVAPGDGAMAARAEKAAEEDQPCSLTPEAGYRRLENQLYRVEVHKGGALGTATFKWSRDNGAVVARWEEQDSQNNNKLTVSSTGKDDVLNFATGQWVELSDDVRELNGERGVLVQLENVEGNVLTIKASTINDPDNPGATEVDIDDFTLNPKIRRWDCDGEIVTGENDWIDLEDGVQVVFSGNEFKTGDYWLIPARTESADIEWPRDPETLLSLYILPHGIRHDYCRLAVMRFDGEVWSEISDCRNLFPPVTQLTSLFYVSGDGQEAMPGKKLPKPLQVAVSNGQWPVAGIPVAFSIISTGGALDLTGITDTVVSSTAGKVVMLTDENGIAQCNWQLDGDQTRTSQQVEAVMLNAAGEPVHLPVRFNANLSVAEQVAYTPENCGYLKNQGVSTVHEALEELCAKKLILLSYVGGDGQEAMPGQLLGKPLQVAVADANTSHPVEGALIVFKLAPGNGELQPTAASNIVSSMPIEVTVKTGVDGIAECGWKLDNNPVDKNQRVVARLVDDGGVPHHLPVHFNASLSQAQDVAFTPDCLFLKGKNVATVKDALEQLCDREVSESKGCSVTVGKGGMFETLESALGTLFENGHTDICICMLPGEHTFPKGLTISPPEMEKPVNIKISGCGPQTRFIMKNIMKVTDLHSFVLSGINIQLLNMFAIDSPHIVFFQIDDLTVESCAISGFFSYPVAVFLASIGKANLRDNLVIPTHLDAVGNIIETLTNDGFSATNLAGDGDLTLISQPLTRLSDSFGSAALSMRPGASLVAENAAEPDDSIRMNSIDLIDAVFNGAVERDRIGTMLDESAASDKSPIFTAVAINDGNGDITLENNIFYADVSVYGLSSNFSLSQSQLKTLDSLLDQQKVTLKPSWGWLKMRGNQLDRITIGKEFADFIKQTIGQGGGEISRIFNKITFTDNIVMNTGSSWLTNFNSIDQNLFLSSGVVGPNFTVGISLANRACISGNHCEYDDNLDGGEPTMYSVTGRNIRTKRETNFFDVEAF